MKLPTWPCLALAALLGAALANPAAAAPGDLIWAVKTDDIIFGAPAISPMGVIVTGSEDGSVYCFNPDGSLRWRFAGAMDWIDSSPTIAPDGTVYVGSWDFFMYALNGHTGSLKWKFETGGMIVGSAALGPDGAVYFGSTDGFFYALRPDGTEKWPARVGSNYASINSSPVLNLAGDTVYFGDDEGFLYAVDTTTGLARWTYTVLPRGINYPSTAITGSPAIGADGSLYFGSRNGFLYALTADGAPRWPLPFNATEPIRSSPVINSTGTLYFAGQDGYLYALDSEGYQLWETFVGDVFYCTPAIDAAGNIILGAYAGSAASGTASRFVSVSSSGNIQWEYIILDYNDSSPNIAPDGSIYIGAHDGYLYKLEGAAPLMRDAQWPRLQANRRNTGNRQDLVALELIDYFPRIASVEGSYAWVPWFGSVALAPLPLPWINHAEHGFQHVNAPHPGSAWLFDYLLFDWLYAPADAPGWFLRPRTNEWMYHAEGSEAASGRWFYHLPAQAWLPAKAVP